MVNLEIIVKDNYAKALTNFAVFVNLIAYGTVPYSTLLIYKKQHWTLSFIQHLTCKNVFFIICLSVYFLLKVESRGENRPAFESSEGFTHCRGSDVR